MGFSQEFCNYLTSVNYTVIQLVNRYKVCVHFLSSPNNRKPHLLYKLANKNLVPVRTYLDLLLNSENAKLRAILMHD